MSLVGFSLKRRVTISMCAVALVIFGVVAFNRLPINLLPNISYPTLTVETRFPGAAPGEVESLVSRPVEEAVGVVAGVQRLTSVSRPGLSQVTLEFAWGRNMDFAALDVREKLDLVTLPKESQKPVLLRFDPANDPVVRLYLTGSGNLYQMRYIADELLKKDLESTEGVAAIKVNGGYEDEIQVQIDEGKLSLLGLSIQDVDQKLLRENVNQAGGSLYEAEARYLVRARNEFKNLDDILRTVLISKDGRNVTMGDVALVTRGHKQREVITRFGGREAVELALYKAGDANTVSVVRAVQKRLERVRAELPAGIEVVTGADQSRFIEASIGEVKSNAIIGGLLSVFVLLLFLKDIVSTLIISVAIPISIIATFFLMYQTGTTLNVMSLGGLALGVGMLVDDAIVVLEAIFKRRERGESGFIAAERGTNEVGRAVVASTLTTVAVFVPIIFVEGIAAQLFRDQALTVSFSLLASLVVSLTLNPMMYALASRERPVAAGAAAAPAPEGAGRLRRGTHALLTRGPAVGLGGLRRGLSWTGRRLAALCRPVTTVFDAGLDALTRSYPPALRWALRSRAMVLGLALALFLVSLGLARGLGVDLIPQFSEGEFSFLIELPEGTPLEATDAYVRTIGEALKDDPRVEYASTLVGGAGLSLTRTGTEGENAARLQVRMKPGTGRSDEEAVAALLRGRLEAAGNARFKFERPSYFTFRTPIEVEVYGDNLDDLQASAAALKKRVETIPGLVDVKSSMETGNPELQVTFHRAQLARLGLDLGQVAATMRNKVQGEVATRFLEGDREIDIRVRSVEVGRASVSEVNDMIVGQHEGIPIQLKAVADVRLAEGPSEIRRIGQKRAAVISGNLSGRDMGAVAVDVRRVIRAQPFPAGILADLSGQEEEMQRSFRSLLMAMALAIFLVYLVMACEFESLVHPFVVMFTVPLGAIGAILALVVTGRSVNVVAMIGAVMLAGIVVKNAIVLIDAVNLLRSEGLARDEALVQAGLKRMRPILMTTATTILGLVPMALGLGEGAELRAPLAITVIGGLSVATALTLFVIPVVYTLLDRKVYAAAAAAEPGAAPAGSGAAGGEPALDREPGDVEIEPGIMNPALATEAEVAE
ncbi:MAG TPA: efflux RND transporter permease subunit [Candidatus Polarisedimenticolia bacterium]|nr:efflux RND transporter permease subunit [Candidatus Polarisedimenticolia bacterium]